MAPASVREPPGGTTARWRTRPARTGGGECRCSTGAGLTRLGYRLDVKAVAGVGRHAAGARVRAAQETGTLELGHHIADGGGADVKAVSLDQRVAADRLRPWPRIPR